jgi:hypothetical protein
LERHSGFDEALTVDALLATADIECAAADAGIDETDAARVTDTLADALLAGRKVAIATPDVDLPRRVGLGVCEGFAYYGLHPLDYAFVPARAAERRKVAVVGIRTIGVALAAIVAATVRAQRCACGRISVRPTGPRSDRQFVPSPTEQAWIERWRTRGAVFLVVDDGPGLSGSTFLSVADALVAVGIPAADVVLMPSRVLDPSRLIARDAEARWSRYRICGITPHTSMPRDRGAALRGGTWRARWLGEAPWPAVWPELERLKFLTADGEGIVKFEGLGRTGRAAFARAELMHGAAWGPGAFADTRGFVRYERVGRPLAASELSFELVDRIAEYCAWRASHMAAEPIATDALAEMVAADLAHAGVTPCDPPPLQLERVVVPDGHMQPHEWIRGKDGGTLKVDAVAHGDDHFHPGPTDIAWDLAGAIVEWQMPEGARARLLARYRAVSGDAIEDRLPAWLTAYAAFRSAWCRLGAGATGDDADSDHLQAAADDYAMWARRAHDDPAKLVP